MKNYSDWGTSMKMQCLLDSYFFEMYENGEKVTVNQISNELNIHTKTVYRYIWHCTGNMNKTKVFNCMMHTLEFAPTGPYYEIQQEYLENIKRIERKKKARDIVKELLKQQKERLGNDMESSKIKKLK